MASIEAILDAEAAAIVDTALNLLADAQRDSAARAGSPDGRTHQQRRAEALTEVCRAIVEGRPLRMSETPDDAHAENAAATGSTMGPVPAWWEPPVVPKQQQRRRPHLVVTIHAETLAGWDDLPGELAGYGAITAQAARSLARQCGSADLVVLDPPHGSCQHCADAESPRGPADRVPTARSGTPPDRYRPKDTVIHEVIARNRTCRAPGCGRRAEQCDVDHVLPYAQGGRSCPCNLLPLCRRHHRLKTFGGWKLQFAQPGSGHLHGTVEWTSRTGRHFTVPPPDHPGSAHW